MLKRLNAAATVGATVLRKRCCCGAAVRKCCCFGSIIRMGCFEYSRGAFRLFAWLRACSRLRLFCLRLMYGSVVVGLRLQRYNKRNGQSYDSIRYVRLSKIQYDFLPWRTEEHVFLKDRRTRAHVFEI